VSDFDMPKYNPEPPDEEFPVDDQIEYVGSIQLQRAVYTVKGAKVLGWACEHGETAKTPEEAAANCVEFCEGGAYPATDPKAPSYHSRMSDIWDLRERG
jgi:hypothetical protein